MRRTSHGHNSRACSQDPPAPHEHGIGYGNYKDLQGSDTAYRAEFAEDMTSEIREALAVRAVY